MSISNPAPGIPQSASRRGDTPNSRDQRVRLMAASSPSPKNLDAPDVSQRRRIRTLAISDQDGVYRLGVSECQRLAVAVDDAHRQPPRPAAH